MDFFDIDDRSLVADGSGTPYYLDSSPFGSAVIRSRVSDGVWQAMDAPGDASFLRELHIGPDGQLQLLTFNGSGPGTLINHWTVPLNGDVPALVPIEADSWPYTFSVGGDGVSHVFMRITIEMAHASLGGGVALFSGPLSGITIDNFGAQMTAVSDGAGSTWLFAPNAFFGMDLYALTAPDQMQLLDSIVSIGTDSRLAAGPEPDVVHLFYSGLPGGIFHQTLPLGPNAALTELDLAAVANVGAMDLAVDAYGLPHAIWHGANTNQLKYGCADAAGQWFVEVIRKIPFGLPGLSAALYADAEGVHVLYRTDVGYYGHRSF